MQVDGTTPMYSWSEFHSQSPGYSSSDGYVSPNPASNGYSNMFPQMPYCPEPSRTRASSNASLIEPPWSYASRSPASTNSTMAYTWASGDKTSDAPGLDYIGGTYPMTSMPILSSVDPMTGFCHYDPKTMMQRDDEENVILFGEHPYGMGPNAHTHPFEQDLDCYWRFFHPNFPIIHRPTFRRLTASPMLYAAMIAIGGHNDDASDQWQHWVELTSWQRLLQACYILESQQALLLAREPKSSLIQATGYDLPFPAALEVWDAESAYEWKSAIQQYPAVFWYIYEISSDLISRPLDTFQSSILLAAYYNRFDTTAPYALQPPTLDLDGHLDSSPGTVRQQLTWKLVHVTPIRALLAIPGESWIFSEKVSSIQAFGGLRRTLQTWVVQLWATDGILAHTAPVKTALQLSVAILEAALGEQQNSMTPEVGTDLGIFFAALVLWSVTTAASTRFKEDHQRPQMPCYHRQPPLSLPLTSRALSSVTSSPQSSLCKPLDQPPLVVDAGTQPALRCLPGIPTSPTSQTRHDSTCMLSHAQITINTIQFLSSALTDFEEVGSQRWTASDLGRCQTGCISLLLWVKLRLRGVSLEDETADGWSSSTGESLGELLDGIITMLEKMLGRGWDEWGI
ncbi:hypothetical protein J1614_003489 [Plenodomus biglobosus]|nr:hypothetical protein J1614_003489 [Plenodomus biglobosus]